MDQIITEEKLNEEGIYKFNKNAFRDGYIQATGTSLTKVLPPISRFSPTGERTKKRETILQRLREFFNRFWDISEGEGFGGIE